MKCHIMQHFIKVCTVCWNKIDLLRKKYNLFLIITCDPSIYTMDHPDFIVCSFMENSIGLKRVNKHSVLVNFSLSPQCCIWLFIMFTTLLHSECVPAQFTAAPDTAAKLYHFGDYSECKKVQWKMLWALKNYFYAISKNNTKKNSKLKWYFVLIWLLYNYTVIKIQICIKRFIYCHSFNPLLHRLFLDHDIIFYFLDNIEKIQEKI